MGDNARETLAALGGGCLTIATGGVVIFALTGVPSLGIGVMVLMLLAVGLLAVAGIGE